jgi:hypothetical protein
MSDSKVDSRPGVSTSKSDSRPGVSGSRFDSRPGVRSNESIYLGKSPKKACVRLLVLALAAAVVAGAFAASVDFRTWLRVEPAVAPRAAALSGGVATILLVCVVWIWNGRFRWVAISPEGVRWLRGPRARYRRWDQYLGVRRGNIEITVWGQELKAGEYADVEFRKGWPLRISTHTVYGYEDLVSEIQATAAEACPFMFPLGGSKSGLTGPEAHVPLRVHADGVEWDGTHHRWEDIQDYEVAVGYLRIQPTNGPEYMRRLTDLGDWQPVLEQLEANIGARLDAQAKASPTVASPQSQEPAAAP